MTKLGRLITTFVVLAVLAGAVATILTSEPAEVTKSEPASPSSSIPQNAFVESLPSDASLATASGNNLTDELGKSLAQELMARNPSGPENDSLLAPNPTDALGRFLDEPGIYSALVINQAQTLAKKSSSQKVNKIMKPSKADVSGYLASFAGIVDTTLLQENLDKVLTGSPSPEALSSADVVLSQTLRRLDELKVPENLVNLHLAARDIIVGLQGMLRSGQDSQDPLGAVLALEDGSRMVGEAAERLRTEVGKLDKTPLSLDVPTQDNWWTNVIGMPQARAQWVVTDPIHTGVSLAELGEIITEWAKEYFTEKLKDFLINRLVRITVGWVKGEGVNLQPRFITNWRTFFDRITNQIIGEALYEIEPNLCRSFGPLIALQLRPVDVPPKETARCTLDQVVDNVQNFMNDFEAGGWIAYGAMAQPQNDYFGSLINVNSLLTDLAAKEKAAAQQETQAGQGYAGAKECTKEKRLTSMSAAS